MAKNYDVVILGGGPAGYACAIRAAQLGLQTVVVERDKVGGVCVNVGCIPTKALLHSAYVANLIKRDAKSLGVEARDVVLDFAAAVKRSRRVSEQNSKGVAFLLEKNGVAVVHGSGSLLPGRLVQVGDDVYAAGKAVVVATGSRVKGLPRIGLDIDRTSVISSDDALALDRVPSSMAVVGAGPLGMEFAEVFSTFGARVTVIEVLERALPLEDAESSAAIAGSCKKRKIELLVGANIKRVERSPEGVTLEIEAQGKVRQIKVEKVLVAAGRALNVDNIGFERAGVALAASGFVRVDSRLLTTAPDVYAVGDIAGPPMLAHKGTREGIIAAEVIAGLNPAPIDYDNIPSVTYCHPEVASIGLTEEECRTRGVDYAVGRFPLAANGRARASMETDGFVKIIRGTEGGKILGAHVVASHASELIHELALARQTGCGAEVVDQVVHAHPTLSEAVAEAVLDSWGRAIHL